MCKQSSQQSDQSRFCTNTRTTHTRNKPYRLGAVRAGVVGARGRCCPAATVPVAVVFPCGVCCCIAENIQNKSINRKRELCHRPKTKAHSNEYENEIIVLFQNFRIFCLIFVWELLPKIWGPLPDFGKHSPFPETRPSRNMFSLEWNGDTWFGCFCLLFLLFWAIQQQTTRTITTGTGTVAAGQQRPRAPGDVGEHENVPSVRSGGSQYGNGNAFELSY